MAMVAGVLGVLFALITPFAPVTQTTATIEWPQNGLLQDVDAPLVSQAPLSLTATLPCSAVAAS